MDTENPSRRHQAATPRILVDGLDLSGKTTLTHAITITLSEHGIPAARHRGMLAEHHALEQWLYRRFRLVASPRAAR